MIIGYLDPWGLTRLMSSFLSQGKGSVVSNIFLPGHSGDLRLLGFRV